MQICSVCGEAKNAGEFYRRESGLLRKECKACIRERSRARYHHGGGKEKAHEFASARKEEVAAKNKKYYEENKERLAERWAAYYAEKAEEINKGKRARWAANKEAHAARRKVERAADPEKYRAENKRRTEKDPEKWRKYAREWQKRKRDTDARYRLHLRISKAICKTIKKGSKGGETWPKVVGYSLEELVGHLKGTIPEGYTWADYLSGALHLDHIVPVSAHNFDSPTDADFKKAWALNNLQLLPAFDNMSKGAKLEKPFQPSLKLP